MNPRYSFPYQRALHSRMMRTTLKPVLIIGLCILIALPVFLTAILSTQGSQQCRSFADDFSAEVSACTARLTALSSDELALMNGFLKDGRHSVAVYELLYALRNHYAPGAYFELTTPDGAHRAFNLPAHSLGGVHGDALLWKKLREGGGVVEGVHVPVPGDDDAPVLTLAVPVMDGGTLTGTLALMWLPSWLDETAASGRWATLLTSDTGRMVYQSSTFWQHLSKRFEYEKLAGPLVRFAGGLYLAGSAPVAGTSLTAHVLTGFDFIIPVMLFSGLFMAALVGMMVLLINRLSYQVATGPLLEPFDKLFTALKRYGEGDTLSRIAVDASDDAAPYLSQFNAVLDEVEQLLCNNRELARVTSATELKLLEAQFQPHFMFNMLDMIKYTIRDDPDQAVQMVLTLAHMLRYTLDVRFDQVSVREDLGYLKDYLHMQELRLGEWFAYEINCPDDVLDLPIPKLIMQPLVENSVKYGFTGEKPFLLSIMLERTQTGMLITIRNNGAGMERAQLESLRAALSCDEQTGVHVGLFNTHRRLVLAYGSGAGLHIESQPDGGTCVTMRLAPSETGERI